MYEDLTSRIRYHIQKAEFYGLKEHESTKLLVEAADAIKDLNKTLDEEVEINTALEISQKHGKWKLVHLGCTCGGTITENECSVCGASQLITSNFCPNCGARMVGE